MRQKKEQKPIHPAVRQTITLIEAAATLLLLWFPTMRLDYSGVFATEVTASFFWENTAWALPMQAVQMLLLVTIVAAAVPLFVKQVDRFWTTVSLAAALGVSFISHAALYVTCCFAVGERTVYGLTPQLSLTAAGGLYVLFGVFSFMEAVCTCAALRREARTEREVPEGEQPACEGGDTPADA